MRYAVYFTFAPDEELGRVATQWLGRDVFTGDRVSAPVLRHLNSAEIAFHTAAARRYGFHATLKAPFRLADGVHEDDLINELHRFTAAETPFAIPGLRIGRLSRFFALVPSAPAPELDAFACNVVMNFDRFRAPLTEAEMAKRQPDQLSVAQLRNLYRWGYPHVLDCFRFHMTLTGPVQDHEAPAVRAALHEWFDEALAKPVGIASLSLFVETEPGAPFQVREHVRMSAESQRMTA
ncbi:MAG: DUF1045 domain-containing protein [Minwuia sp.]|uniref:DUF1045 domain-containing protein n=1 Tax=Minwuia sp. TaxID=2493630 RepID=UPI003A85E39B